MQCTNCKGTGHSTARPDGLCPQCLGTGYYRADADYVAQHHEHVASRAAREARLRMTHGKNGTPALQAIKD